MKVSYHLLISAMKNPELDKLLSSTGDEKENFLPYLLYQIYREKGKGTNGFRWSSNSVESIMRPACFIPQQEQFEDYKAWSKGATEYTFNMLFWRFAYDYCDRSNWNSFSVSDHAHLQMSFRDRRRIVDIATTGLGNLDEEQEGEEQDDESIDDIDI